MNERTPFPSDQLPVIWVVEDDPYTLRICLRLLESNGYTCHGFSSAEELLLFRLEATADILLTDIHLPGKSGKELLVELRKTPAELRIIALAGDDLPDERQILSDAGFDDVLVKPFNEQELLNILGAAASVTAHLSFPLLEQLVEDPAERAAILIQFQSETLSDLALLEAAITANHAEDAALYTHRMAGRFGQLGQPELSASLRKIEAKLWENGPIAPLLPELETVMHTIRELLQKLEGLL